MITTPCVSLVTYQVSGVRNLVSGVIIHFFCVPKKEEEKKREKIELVGGGSLINGATQSSFCSMQPFIRVYLYEHFFLQKTEGFFLKLYP